MACERAVAKRLHIRRSSAQATYHRRRSGLVALCITGLRGNGEIWRLIAGDAPSTA